MIIDIISLVILLGVLVFYFRRIEYKLDRNLRIAHDAQKSIHTSVNKLVSRNDKMDRLMRTPSVDLDKIDDAYTHADDEV